MAGRPKLIWKNDIKEDLRNMSVSNWEKCTPDRGKWKEVVEKAKTFKQCSCSACLSIT